MGKGDKSTAKGKRFAGSYGKSRLKKKKSTATKSSKAAAKKKNTAAKKK